MDFLRPLMGGAKPSASPLSEDSDFADFAAAPPPSPISIPSTPADSLPAQPTGQVVYTAWYRVWERTSLSDFKLEGIIIPFMLLMVLVHFWGTRKNKRIAKKWMAVHAPLLDSEFALVGFHDQPKMTPYPEGVQAGQGLLAVSAKLTGDNVPDDMLKEKTPAEYQSFATGRVNVAFMDVIISMHKRYNPGMLAAENILGLFFDSFKPPSEKVETIVYPFNGRETDFVPAGPDGEKPKAAASTYSNFVFAIVNKMHMRRLRDERYDISLTFTRDHAKLPNWATVMTESAEISDLLLTKDIIEGITSAGPDLFEYLIATDQPIDKPTTIGETTPKKRLYLSLKMPRDSNYLSTLPLYASFLRLPDLLVSQGRFRPEVNRKIEIVRETELKKLKKVAETEQEEDRKTKAEKIKREERERKLKGMSAEEQRKFLEKETERDRKKQEKKMSRRG